jgi:hypothetical protein
MRKLLALLLLVLSSPAIAQQVDWSNAVNVPNIVVNPSMNDCPAGVQSPTCGAWKEASGPADWSNQFGSTEYVFSYTNGKLYQDVDLSQYKSNQLNFTFQFDLNNSCRNSIGGYCENVNGPIDEFSAKVYFYDKDGLNNQFTFLSGNPSTARIDCSYGIEIFGLCVFGYSAYDNWEHFGWYSSVDSDTFFDRARIEFTGRDVGFWGGLYGPRVDNPTLTINYLPEPYPVIGGLAGMNVSAPGSDYIFIYKGNDPVMFSQLALKGEDLVGWTAVCEACGNALTVTSIERAGPDYLFLHTDGTPQSGSYYSFQEQAPAVDCVKDPFNPSCVLTTLNIGNTDTTTTTDSTSPVVTTTTVATTTDSSPTQSATTEIVANTSTPSETISTTEKPSDPVLAASVASEAVANAVATNATNPLASSSATQAAYRELSDEEKAAILADAIAKNVIEGALTTIAATSAASAANGSQETSTISTSTKANMGNDVSIDTNAMGMVAENNQQQTETQDTSSAMDILDTGRTIGQQALTNILATSAEFADQAGQQAESIAQGSSVNTGSQELTIKDINQEFTAIEIPMLSQDVQKAEDAVLSAIAEAVQSSDISIDFGVTDDGRPKEIPGLANSVELEQQTLAILDTIKQSAETPTFDDDSKQYEEVILSNNFDPSAAAAFGAPPSVMNLEILGIIGNKPEEKSDAEKRADQIVAANQQQMEEINKNYMDADQSGIIGAIGADTDVSSYRTAMISDADLWYKDKDIYKGIIIKDNVRGSYFLEKGNTDTYKKMVDEQYK